MRSYYLMLRLLLFLSLALFAQLSSTGALQGVLVDSSGSAIAGASITLRNTSSGATRKLNTSPTGQFQVAGLAIGNYSLRFEKTGFTPVVFDSVDLSVGQVVSQRVAMRPAEVNESLEVQEQAEALQPSATTANVVLGGERIEEAPAQARNFLNFVLIAPGVVASPGANTSRSIAGLRNPANDSGVVFNGMRGRNNSISIDGMDNRDETTGGSRVALGLEMIQEFRVSSTSVNAELGGAAGGLINLVTRSGQNLWHGDTTFFTQNEALNARNPEVTSGPKPQFRRYQPGVSTGGPIAHDRTFFFTGIEQTFESNQEWSDTPARLLPLLPNLQSGLFAAGETDTQFSFKFTRLLSNSNTLNARYAFSRGRVRNDVQSTDNFLDRSARGSSLLKDHSLVGNWSHALSASTVNDLRFQVGQRAADLTPNSSGPMYEIPGVITFGQSYRLDQQRTERHLEVIETLQWTHGNHLFSTGISAHTVFLDANIANRFHGLFVFPTLEDYRAGRPSLAIQAFGNPGTNYSTTPIGAWLQDRWQLTPGLSLEAGLRYDYQFLPAPIPSTRRNLAPRLGLAWHPGSTSKWVLRLGAGLFYDRYPLGYLNDAIQKDGVNAYEVFLTGNTNFTAPNLARTSYKPAPGFLSTYGRKFTAGLERKLDRDTTLTVEASSVRGIHLPRTRNTALTIPPQFNLEQTASSSYTGIATTLNRRLSKDLTYLFSYNLSRTLDDASDYDEQPLDPRNLRQEWALSRLHQKHRFTASGLFEPVDTLTIAPVFQWGSARPLNPVLPIDSLLTGAYPLSARPIGLGRNSQSIPANLSLDLRIMKTILVMQERARLQFGIESFNLLNHTNRLRVSPYFTPTFGALIEAQNSRQVQLMIQFEY